MTVLGYAVTPMTRWGEVKFLLILWGGVYELLLSVENGGTVLFEGWPPLFVEGDGSFVRGF